VVSGYTIWMIVGYIGMITGGSTMGIVVGDIIGVVVEFVVLAVIVRQVGIECGELGCGVAIGFMVGEENLRTYLLGRT
jgi:hypothetical protein